MSRADQGLPVIENDSDVGPVAYARAFVDKFIGRQVAQTTIGKGHSAVGQAQLRTCFDDAMRQAARIAFEEGKLEGIREVAEGAEHDCATDDEHEGCPIDQETLQDSPIDASSSSDRRVMMIHFMDGSHLGIPMQRIHDAGGWVTRNLNGVDQLIIGHGVPRSHYPLCNIRGFDLGVEA